MFEYSKSRSRIIADVNIGTSALSYVCAALLSCLFTIFLAQISLTKICIAQENEWREQKKIVKIGVATDNAPYSFIDNKGEPRGFSVDLIEAVAQAANISWQVHLGKSDVLWNDLVAGKIDALPMISKLHAHSKLVSFSMPHTETHDAFFRPIGQAVFRNIEEAKGKEIIVLRSGLAHQELLKRNFSGQLIFVDTIDEGLKLLATGQHHALLCSKLIGTIELAKLNAPNIIAGPAIPDYKRNFVFAVKKGDTELLAQIDYGLSVIKEEEIYEDIADRWIRFADPVQFRLVKYILPAFMFLVTIIVIIGTLLGVIRWLVKKHTKELSQKNQMLQNAREELTLKVNERTEELAKSNSDLKDAQHLRDIVIDFLRLVNESHGVDEVIESVVNFLKLRFHCDKASIIGTDNGNAPFLNTHGQAIAKFDSGFWVNSVADIFKQNSDSIDLTAFYEYCLKEGYESVAVLPLKISNRCVAILILGSSQTAKFTSQLITFLEDLTDHLVVALAKYQADDLVLQREREWQRTFDCVPDLIAIIDNNHRIMRVNQAMANKLGVTPAQCVGLACYETVHNCGSPPTFCPHVATMMDGKQHSVELFEERMGGHILVSTTPFANAAGKMIGSVHVARDINQLKANEAELRAAKLSADQANQAKSVFLANMSHEIRTPLNSILGFSELLKNDELYQKEKTQFLDAIIRSGQHLATLIDDILDLSKVESDEFVIEAKPFDTHNFIQNLNAIFIPKTAFKKITLSFVQDTLPRVIVSDETRLRQILINIIGNAVKFTPTGGIIEVKISFDSNNNLMTFVVSDNGIGIPLEQRERIFDPFYQADNSITRKFGGTGLGLPLSRKLARQLGGDVVLTPSNVGSIFIVSVRVRVETKQQSREAVSESDRPISLEGLNVLVAEDMVDSQLLVKNIINNSGAAVTIVDNGQDVIAKALTGNYDIILMDIRMPVKDGLTATQELRAQGYTKPIIALTAHALRDEQRRSIAAGCNAHLSKPIVPNLLLTMLNKYKQV